MERGTGWLAHHSITLLRVSLGLVFLAFGAIKLAGVSPAEDLAVRTVDTLTLGMVSGDAALLMTALVEMAIGVTLTTGRMLKTGLVILGGSLVAIMSPLVLFFGEMFPDGAPTLAAQYVLKDIILVAAGLVVAARALGARMVTDDGRSAH
ncbi:DoxX family protein [Phytoactinopolyspora halotolerans]|uniref:DoxX family protein n=1 Tax=Phytoactinopolyspora halotolerans TaxID=1981512 RepID=A0A6L9S5T2_9ACTN|nr:DoxX family protein [Phytoactinopolyspora halotolerans]